MTEKERLAQALRDGDTETFTEAIRAANSPTADTPDPRPVSPPSGLAAEDWERVERAIWPNGPAHGHGSGEYAILKAKVLAGHPSTSVEALTLGLTITSWPMPRTEYERGWNEALAAVRKKAKSLDGAECLCEGDFPTYCGPECECWHHAKATCTHCGAAEGDPAGCRYFCTRPDHPFEDHADTPDPRPYPTDERLQRTAERRRAGLHPDPRPVSPPSGLTTRHEGRCVICDYPGSFQHDDVRQRVRDHMAAARAAPQADEGLREAVERLLDFEEGLRVTSTTPAPPSWWDRLFLAMADLRNALAGDAACNWTRVRMLGFYCETHGLPSYTDPPTHSAAVPVPAGLDVPPKRSRKTLTDLRDEAEARGITYWDSEWTRQDFLDEFARALSQLPEDPK